MDVILLLRCSFAPSRRRTARKAAVALGATYKGRFPASWASEGAGGIQVASKKKESGAPLLIFMVAVFLLVFLTFAIAVGIVCLWAYREVTSRSRIADLKGRLDHSESELSTVHDLEERHATLLKERNAIESEGAHLSRRKDGYFQERSSLARDLNVKLKMVVESGRRTEAELRQLHELPERRRSECVELAATLQSSRAAVACLALISGFIALLDPAWATSVGAWIINWGLWVPNLDPMLYSAVILSTWIAVGLHFLVRETARAAIAESLSEAPAGRAETNPNPTRS